MSQSANNMAEASGGLPARRVALALLEAVLCRGELLGRAQAAQAAGLRRLDAADRALAEHIVRTTLRRHGQLGVIVGRFLRRPLPRKACVARAALMMGAAQLLFMRVPAHAAIHTTVQLLKKHPRARHMAGLANAVLRRIAEGGEALAGEVDELENIPRWLRKRWQAAYGEEAVREMARELVREPPLDISLKHPQRADAWAERLGGVVLPTKTVRIEHPVGAVHYLPGYEEGEWWVQDAAAALPVLCMGDVRGLRVADLCAAPGGKTAQLAARGALVTAVDISQGRLQRLRENLLRLKLSAEIVATDVLQWRPAEPYDAVLLDAPCSATGTFRRHPDVLLTKTPEQVAKLVALQRDMLARAAALVRPGGLMVYCVCSLLPEEGEEQAEYFLRAHGDAFERLPVQAEEIGGLAHLIMKEGDVRTLPHLPIGKSRGMDGFFIARFRRRA